jgi:hypothetical protein
VGRGERGQEGGGNAGEREKQWVANACRLRKVCYEYIKDSVLLLVYLLHTVIYLEVYLIFFGCYMQWRVAILSSCMW